MNLFYLDEDFKKNAEYHVDSHQKMILESAQLLSTTFQLQGITAPYKLTHKNHPTAVWCRESRENFLWVCDYNDALTQEFFYRFGKVHKSSMVMLFARHNIEKLSFPKVGLTPFALAMPDQYKTSCPIQSYRNYYRGEKQHLFKWTLRDKPEWL